MNIVYQKTEPEGKVRCPMVEQKPHYELGVSEILEWCVDGCPGGALARNVAAAHRIAWARFQETGDANWRDVAENCVRTMSLVRIVNEADTAAIVDFYREIPVAAWPKCPGWSRSRVRSDYLRCARRTLEHEKRAAA